MELPKEVSAVLRRTAEGRELHQKALGGEFAPEALALLKAELRELENQADRHNLARSKLLHTSVGSPKAPAKRAAMAQALYLKITENLSKVSAIRYFVQNADRANREATAWASPGATASLDTLKRLRLNGKDKNPDKHRQIFSKP